MREIWLRPNLRALRLGTIVPVLLLISGGALLLAEFVVPAVILLLIGLLGVAGIARELRRPRLAYEDGEVLAYLRAGSPIRIPVEIVEGFLIGQAPSLLPGGYHERYETTTFILRLSDSAAEWSHGDVKPALGRWCDGYITIRGTWCEPLSVPLARRLNERLAEIHASRRERQSA